jgi:anaerobic dimethyl sulfoxide reductase subunit C
MTEWPLIAFTVVLEMACGSAIAATLFDWTMQRSEPASLRALGISVFPLALLALLASLFHLGRPLSAWRAFANLGASRLSLEVLVCALFTLVALAYSLLWLTARSEGRPVLGVATCVVGLAAVAASVAVYLIPEQPAWNSGWVPVSFLGTVLLLGGMAPVLLFDCGARGSWRRAFLAMIFLGALALLASAAWMIVRLSQVSPDDFVSAQLQAGLHAVMSQHAVWLGLHVLLACILPLVVSVLLWQGGAAHAVGPGAWRLLYLAVGIGVVLGRAIMFAIATLPES